MKQMLLKNRIIAREGPRKKDGVLQHYDFSQVEFKEKWLTLHTHPINNIVTSDKIVGRFFNERVTDGNLIVDMDIFDDELNDDELQILRDHQDVSIGYWYEAATDENIAHPVRKVQIINHVAIGTEQGVCSFPECGLKVAAADNKNPYDTDLFGIEKMANPTQLNVGCDEKDATIEKLTNELKDTQEALKVAQDSITTYESDEKSKLIESLAKRLKVDADSLKDRKLDDLKKLDQDTAKLAEPVGLVLKKKENPKEGADQAEDSVFKLNADGSLPLKSHVKGHDFYEGANKK